MLARLKSRRPSPALIISCIALFVALSGVAYAAALPKNSVGTKQIKTNGVSSSEIKSNAVAASEVKNNSLGGDDIDESKLGTVPSATNATNATTASSVSGSNVTKISFLAASSTADSVIFQSNGLTLKAGCSAGSNLTITAATSVSGDFESHTIEADVPAANAIENLLDLDVFSTGLGDVSLLNAGATPDASDNDKTLYFSYGNGQGGLAIGTLLIDEPDGAPGPNNDCQARGFIQSSS